MKNKKWKRKAKRILGRCYREGCGECEFRKVIFDEYFGFSEECLLGIPPLQGIRRMEEEFNINRKYQSRKKLPF